VIGQLEKIRRELTSQFKAYFARRIFLKKYARMQANDAQVKAINAQHPGADVVHCTILSNGMCYTRA
jgi:hypothetical protein